MSNCRPSSFLFANAAKRRASQNGQHSTHRSWFLAMAAKSSSRGRASQTNVVSDFVVALANTSRLARDVFFFAEKRQAGPDTMPESFPRPLPGSCRPAVDPLGHSSGAGLADSFPRCSRAQRPALPLLTILQSPRPRARRVAFEHAIWQPLRHSFWPTFPRDI